jgi:hypothetical protein
MNLHNEWMTDNTLFGDDYSNQLQIQQAKERFEIQKHSNEGKDAIIDGGITERVVTQKHTNSTLPNKDYIKVHTDLDSNIHVGSVVVIKGVTHIVTDDIKNNGAYKSTEMQITNNTLRFYNKTGILFTIPVIVSDGYSTKLEETKYINLLNNEIFAIIPNSETSLLINLNDIFEIGRNKYEATFIDYISQVGLLKLKMKVSE